MQGFNFDPNAAGNPAMNNFAFNPMNQAMGRGNQMFDLQQEMQRAQMAGASPDRMMDYQQRMQAMQRDAGNWLAGNRGMQSAMTPRVSAANNMSSSAYQPQGANDFYSQLIAALGMGGMGGPSTMMG